MKSKLPLLMPLLGIFCAACTSDCGYDPRVEYADRTVDYIVYGEGYSSDSYLPKCTEKLEGKLFYVKSNSKVYACIEGEWSEMRSLDATSQELVDVPYYGSSSY